MIHTLESWDTHWTHTSKAWDTVGHNNYKFWDTLYLQDCPPSRRHRQCFTLSDPKGREVWRGFAATSDVGHVPQAPGVADDQVLPIQWGAAFPGALPE